LAPTPALCYYERDQVVTLENLFNSLVEALRRVKRMAGRPVAFVHGNERDLGTPHSVFDEQKTSALMHFSRLNGHQGVVEPRPKSSLQRS